MMVLKSRITASRFVRLVGALVLLFLMPSMGTPAFAQMDAIKKYLMMSPSQQTQVLDTLSDNGPGSLSLAQLIGENALIIPGEQLRGLVDSEVELIKFALGAELMRHNDRTQGKILTLIEQLVVADRSGTLDKYAVVTLMKLGFDGYGLLEGFRAQNASMMERVEMLKARLGMDELDLVEAFFGDWAMAEYLRVLLENDTLFFKFLVDRRYAQDVVNTIRQAANTFAEMSGRTSAGDLIRSSSKEELIEHLTREAVDRSVTPEVIETFYGILNSSYLVTPGTGS